MSDASEPVAVTLTLSTPDPDDAARLDRLARGLRSEIKGIGLDSVALATDTAAAPGAKGDGAAIPGVLILEGVLALLPKVVEYLQSWIMRGQNQEVKIEIQRGKNKISLAYTPKSASHEEIEALVAKITRDLK
jgi:hypothetical protein